MRSCYSVRRSSRRKSFAFNSKKIGSFFTDIDDAAIREGKETIVNTDITILSSDYQHSYIKAGHLMNLPSSLNGRVSEGSISLRLKMWF